MAKNLLLAVLLDKLGEYVDADSLASDNLKLGVFSGKLELANLRLNRHALRTASGIVFMHRSQLGYVFSGKGFLWSLRRVRLRRSVLRSLGLHSAVRLFEW